MMAQNILYVFLGGGLGCVVRYLISWIFIKHTTLQFPVGTFVANFISCLVLALVVLMFKNKTSLISTETLRLFLIVGFCGGLSTFSTFGYETFSLIRQGFLLTAVLNVLISLIAGIGVLFLLLGKDQS